jgi:hypothetical protein
MLHTGFRKGLVALLRAEGFDVVGEASDVQEAVGLADQESPDLVLMDLSMPSADGFDATVRITWASSQLLEQLWSRRGVWRPPDHDGVLLRPTGPDRETGPQVGAKTGLSDVRRGQAGPIVQCGATPPDVECRWGAEVAEVRVAWCITAVMGARPARLSRMMTTTDPCDERGVASCETRFRSSGYRASCPAW